MRASESSGRKTAKAKEEIARWGTLLQVVFRC